MALKRTRGGAVTSGFLQTAKVTVLFGVWYALNVVYNIKNKKVLNALPLPWLVAVSQLGVGSAYALAAWLLRLRDAPWGVGPAGLRALAPIGAAHGLGQVATVLSLGAGAVSFTHIVKALEPFFSALASALICGEWLRPQVYATLLLVVGGVGLAVATELSFSWLAFLAALASNALFALRAVLSKVAMAKKGAGAAGAPQLSAPTIFGVVTCLSFALMLPLALAAEGPHALNVWRDAAVKSGSGGAAGLASSVALSGLFHYTNNEVMYMVLDNVHPVTLAVGNTLKRVVIIVASLLVFKTPMTPAAAAGSAVGISGVLVYSLVKQHYDKVDAAAQL